MIATVTPLRANRDYWAWFVGDTANLLGSAVRGFAMPLLALDLGGSATFAGLVGSATLIAEVAGHVPGGAITDRYNRRRLMYISAATGMALYSTMVTAWVLDGLTPAILLALAVLTGLRSGLFGTVTDSCLRSIVPADLLGQATAANEARDASLNLVGAPIGGLLYAAGRIVPFVVDCVSYGALMVSARLIRADLGAMTDHSEPLLRHAAGGARQIWRSPLARRILAMTGLLMIGVRGILVVAVLSMREDSMTSGLIGLVQACAGAGTLLGAVISARAIGRVRGATLLFAGLGLEVAAIVALITSNSPLVIAVGLIAMTLSMPISNSVIMGFFTAITPPQLQGRVFAFSSAMILGMQAVSPAIAGWGLATLGWTATVAVFLTVTAFGVVLAAASPTLRQLPRSTEWSTMPCVADSIPGPA